MTKSVQQYTKIFEVLQNAKAPVPVSTIRAIDGIVATRLSTYLWEIKKNTGFAVRANRDGRTVVSYELVGAGTAPVAKPAKVKAVKTAKAPVVKAAKRIAGIVCSAPDHRGTTTVPLRPDDKKIDNKKGAGDRGDKVIGDKLDRLVDVVGFHDLEEGVDDIECRC